METMEVMNNEEVMEVVEMVTPKSVNGLKVAGGIGIVALAGYGIYKGVKWVKAKKQAKKEQEELDAMCEPEEDVEA